MRYRIRTIPEAEDLIISAISETGLSGAQIEDKVPLTAAEKEQIYTYDADDPVDDGVAFVSFYGMLAPDGRLSPEEGAEALLSPDELRARMEEALASCRRFAEIGDGTIDMSIMDDSEWKDKWKQYFKSFRIDDILVVPGWEDAEDCAARQDSKPAYILRMDPGMAFGTGARR